MTHHAVVMMVSVYKLVKGSSIFDHPKLIGDSHQYNDCKLIDAIKGCLHRTKDYLEEEIERVERSKDRQKSVEIDDNLGEVYHYFINYKEIVERLLRIDDVEAYLNSLKDEKNKPFNKWINH